MASRPFGELASALGIQNSAVVNPFLQLCLFWIYVFLWPFLNLPPTLPLLTLGLSLTFLKSSTHSAISYT